MRKLSAEEKERRQKNNAGILARVNYYASYEYNGTEYRNASFDVGAHKFKASGAGKTKKVTLTHTNGRGETYVYTDMTVAQANYIVKITTENEKG